MVLGAVRCPLEKSREIAVRLREIKVRHKLSCVRIGRGDLACFIVRKCKAMESSNLS